MNLRPSTPLTGALRGAPVLVCGAALAACCATPAHAAITPAQIIAGPDKDIVELGGVALAADGTGGAIWRTQNDSGSHIFVARYLAGRWTSPQRVDTAQPYNSFAPALAAGPGGRLMAVFAQVYAQTSARSPVYRLQAAHLPPHATRFEPPFTIDTKLADRAGNANPDQLDPIVRMNDAGVAYLTYRVVTDARPTTVAFPNFPGRVNAQFRAARFNGASWSRIGVINRNAAYTVPPAAPGNGPQVSVDVQGNGVVAFLEPGADGVDRVWARRLFGARPGYVLKASPQSWNGQPIPGNADGFSLSGGGLGTAVVAVRQQPGRPSPLASTTLFTNVLADSESDGARDFLGPKAVPGVDGTPGVPLAATGDDAKHSVAFAAGGTGQRSGIVSDGPVAPSQFEASGVFDALAYTAGPGGATAAAWPITRAGAEAVAIRQTLGDATERAVVSGGTPGAVIDLHLGGSGFGDALVGFRQDVGDQTRLVAAAVQVAPQAFFSYPPSDWVRPAQASLTWDRPASGVGGLTYDVLLDGRVARRGLIHPGFHFAPDDIDDGIHEIRIRATDASGQSATTRPAKLTVDGTGPFATATPRAGRRLRVAVKDRLPTVAPDQVSGVNAEKVTVRFGDGTVKRGSITANHRYKKRGRYTVRVTATDQAGNAATTELRVTAR